MSSESENQIGGDALADIAMLNLGNVAIAGTVGYYGYAVTALVGSAIIYGLAVDERQKTPTQSSNWKNDIENYDQQEYAKQWNDSGGFRTAPPLYVEAKDTAEE